MKNITLSFQVHHPFRLKKYRFFDIGNDSYYYDDFENEHQIRFAAENFYLPANEILISLLKKYSGEFKISFAISGIILDQFYLYAPEVLESFQRLADTGGVEFLGGTYSHSLASIQRQDEFIRQVEDHSQKINHLFDQNPSVFKNTELIYSDEIGRTIAGMGFKAVLTEGSKRVLKWRSPNFLYSHPGHHEFSVLFKNNHLSEQLAFRLSHPDWPAWPGSGNNFALLLNHLPEQEKVINLEMNYDLVGKGQQKISGIFNFLKSFPGSVLELTNYRFKTLSEVTDEQLPISDIPVPELISSEDYKNEILSNWLGNELQQEAIAKLYSIHDKIQDCTNPDLWKDWQYLQSTDHFYYMSSTFFSNQDRSFLNPYNNPYEAFINYMNILDDFIDRVNQSVKRTAWIFKYAKSREMIKEKSI